MVVVTPKNAYKIFKSAAKRMECMASERQKKAVRELAENGGSKGAAMLKAGYSKISSLTPKKLTDSKGYKELMEEVIPDKFLTAKHKELLSTPIKTRTTRAGEFISEEISLDVQAISKGLDMAYKVKGHYAPERKEISGNLSLSKLFNANEDDNNTG